MIGAVAVSRDRVVVGVSGGEAIGGVGLLVLGAVAALVAIPIYRRAVASIWDHQHRKAQAAIEANKVELAHLIAEATHAKTQAARYRSKR